MDDTLDTAAKETEAEFGSEYDFWRISVELAEKAQKPWAKAADVLTRMYAAKRAFDHSDLRDPKQPDHIFYSNIATLQPAVYSGAPKVVVQRRFKDRDPIGRLAAQIAERATQSAIDCEDFEPAIKALRDDWLIRSRGQAREVYEPITGEKTDAMGSYTDVFGAQTLTKYVHWRDFLYPNVRSWGDVQKRWVAFRNLMSRDELVERFGDKGQKVPLDSVPRDVNESENIGDKEPFKQATIYEVWDAKKKRVIWFSKHDDGRKEFLDEQPDPLDLRGFFPCPRPIFATLDNDSLYPTADYIFYSDLAEQLHLIQWKIDCLIRALKVVGARDASCKELDRIVSESCEFELIPVENWPVFAEKGGLQGAIVWMPMGEITQTLQVLYQAQQQTMQRIYETSGISDILRGYSNPQKTATAVNREMQTSTPRLDERRREMDRFLRDLVRIKSEIIVEKYTDEHLYLAADVDQMSPQEQQLFPQAVALLRNDKLRTFRIDIETDATSAANNEQLRQDRIEVMSHVGTFLRDISPIVGAQPTLLPMAKEMLLFSMRAFKESRSLEGAVEEAFDQLLAQPPPQQQPDPAAMKAQQDAQIEQQRMSFEAQKFQFFEAQMRQAEQQLKQQEILAKTEADKAKFAAEIEKIKIQADVEMRKLAAEIQKSDNDRAAQIYMQQQQAMAPVAEKESGSGSNKQTAAPTIQVFTGGKKRVSLMRPDGSVAQGIVEEMED